MRKNILVPDSMAALNSNATCNAYNPKRGKYCTRPAGWGTDHAGVGNCKVHGGSTPNGRLYARKQELQARMPVMGLPVDVDPMDALIQCVRITAGEIEYCTARVSELEEEAAILQREESTRGYSEEKGKYKERKRSNDTSLNIWVRARHDALDRLARYSKMAIDAGVDERQVRVAESMGQTIGMLLQRVLTGLSLTPEQEALAPVVVRREMAAITAGAAAE